MHPLTKKLNGSDFKLWDKIITDYMNSRAEWLKMNIQYPRYENRVIIDQAFDLSPAEKSEEQKYKDDLAVFNAVELLKKHGLEVIKPAEKEKCECDNSIPRKDVHVKKFNQYTLECDKCGKEIKTTEKESTGKFCECGTELKLIGTNYACPDCMKLSKPVEKEKCEHQFVIRHSASSSGDPNIYHTLQCEKCGEFKHEAIKPQSPELPEPIQVNQGSMMATDLAARDKINEIIEFLKQRVERIEGGR